MHLTACNLWYTVQIDRDGWQGKDECVLREKKDRVKKGKVDENM